mgnify:FL=1
MKMHRSIVMAAVLGSSLALIGCKGSNTPSGQETGTPEVSTANGPDAKPGVTAGAARLVLPIVAGRPGVAYFRVTNTTSAQITLVGVHLNGVEKTEMHRTSGGKMSAVDKVDITSGASIAFAPGGLHVMAFDIANTLKAGDSAEMTLTFADGDKVSLPAKVEAMGDHAGMAGAQH